MCHNVTRETHSIRELHIHTSQLVREAADGSIIMIEREASRWQSCIPSPLYPENLASNAKVSNSAYILDKDRNR